MYSDKVRRHFLDPHNVGPLPYPTHEGRAGRPGVGNYMVIQLKVESDRIVSAAFQTYGCVGAISCGCELTDMVTGRSVEEALDLQAEDLLRSLGGLPMGKEHCAGLAVSALRKAFGAESA